MFEQESSPIAVPTWDCVIAGAGMAGLAARRALIAAGLRVMTLEKSQGLGGRMATRRFESSGPRRDTSLVDLGAQFVSARSSDFQALVDSADMKAIRLNGDAQHPRFVHRSGMSRMVHALLREGEEESAPILRRSRVVQLREDSVSKLWRVRSEDGLTHDARAVLVTAPLPQALELFVASEMLAQTHTEISLSNTSYTSCIAVFFKLPHPSGLVAPGILKNVSLEVSGIFDQVLKGLRSTESYLVVHATPRLSRDYWDCPSQETIDKIWASTFPHLPGFATQSESFVWDESNAGLHRWRYCEPEATVSSPFYRWTGGTPLFLAGDAFGASRVEGAYHSGLQAAHALLAELRGAQSSGVT